MCYTISMDRKTACFFSGNREIEDDEERLKQRINVFVFGVRMMGATTFLVGGARGFDMLAAESVLSFKNTDPKVRLILVQPCREQTKGWEDEDIKRYERIKKEADEVVCLSEEYYQGCMHVRNRYLVDNADYGIVYSRKEEGGTTYTLSYAEKKGKKIYKL